MNVNNRTSNLQFRLLVNVITALGFVHDRRWAKNIAPALLVRFVVLPLCLTGLSLQSSAAAVQFTHAFAPQDGILAPVEKPYRSEICLNGLWKFEPVPVPPGFRQNVGPAPDLSPPTITNWSATPIRIPSPWNVNKFAWHDGLGGDFRSFPSYPDSWSSVQMGWLARSFFVPTTWTGRRVYLHFNAVAGSADVMVNGAVVGHHFDAFLPFDVDITSAIHCGSNNNLLVGVRKPSLFDVDGPYGRRTYQGGSMWGQYIAGIWQDVYLESTSQVAVENVFVKPLVNQDRLLADVTVRNDTDNAVTVHVRGSVRQWISLAGKGVLSAPEPRWKLSSSVVLQSEPVTTVVVAHGESAVTLEFNVNNRLKFWSPEQPNLYGLVCSTTGSAGAIIDAMYTRFGWRQLLFDGSKLMLNGSPLVMKGDSWHFLGIPEMSRRYAWAWFTALKAANGNAVRLHAEPYPEFFLDVADEMGILVLDEDANWASDGGPKLDDQSYWDGVSPHITGLILRDRNHPAVFGWSISNEIMPVVRNVFHAGNPMQDKVVAYDSIWATLCRNLDPTRQWISADGEEDGGGSLPTFVIHYGGDGDYMRAIATGKPWGVGEDGPAYYGSPDQIAQQSGDENAYNSAEDRMDGVAAVSYRSLMDQRKYGASYRSVFNLVWYGLKPLALGMHDTTKPPTLDDGVFFPKFVEGAPGVQPERIGPYCTTLNPGYDSSLPLYDPWPLFNAIKDANAEPPTVFTPLTSFVGVTHVNSEPNRSAIPSVTVLSGTGSSLSADLTMLGVDVSSQNVSSLSKVLFVDGAASPSSSFSPIVKSELSSGGTVFVWGVSSNGLTQLNTLLPEPLVLTNRSAVSLVAVSPEPLISGLTPSDLYFADSSSPDILQAGLSGPLVDKGTTLLTACNTNWMAWNGQPETDKTAMLLRSERESKPSGAALIEIHVGLGTLIVCSISPAGLSTKAISLNRHLLANLGVALGPIQSSMNSLNGDGQVERVLVDTDDVPKDSVSIPGIGPNASLLATPDSSNTGWREADYSKTQAIKSVVTPGATTKERCVQFVTFWISCPETLNNLLLDPHQPVVNLDISSVVGAQAWVNDSTVPLSEDKSKFVAHALPLNRGWNRVLLKLQNSDTGSPVLTFRCSPADFLAELRGTD